MTVFSCDNVSLSYDKNTVLSDLSFSVKKGDYLCIVGENGSGKSTLMKALLGLIPTASGSILYSDGFSKRSIAYLAQQNELQKEFPASVYEVVLSGRLSQKGIFGFYHKEDRARCERVMEELSITPYRDRSFRELSGGQQQRVLLARALVSEAELLFVDEPTTGLDPVVTQEFYRLIERAHKSGMTVVMVTHDIEAAVRYATDILHLQNKPLFFGSVEDYLASDVGRRYCQGV